ncbi:Antibiotic biosynthesis monooxygenase [Marinomonas aquimarina]|uniref:Antibiotic biosynthesis monooxygenase n=1 Tax=Marinomonas aquimarina TaxID=295068 RepID=A0A1A8T9X1_9GAMM|nr:antibiotic biosynthesis monooxygenase [Marinomonas aquimarina]SBS28448.1 Antibiotic biosynthesis monooxygenase [Marinomonas aquimarina]
MIRVIYEWQVKRENLQEFSEAWEQTTVLVREMYQGAFGSTLLQDGLKVDHLLTIARWSSEEDWRNFWSSDNPPEVTKMSKLGNLVSIKIYEELGNHISK